MVVIARVMDDLVQMNAGPESGRMTAESEKGGGTSEGVGERVGGEFEEEMRAALLQRIGTARYELWFDGKVRMSVDGNALIVEAGSAFAVRFIREKFSDELGDSGRQVLRRNVEVCVRMGEGIAVRQELTSPEVRAVAVPAAAAPVSSSVAAQGQMNLKYTLDEFVMGPSNRLAYHAAVQVAQSPGEQFNPLFIHGHCGLGKTHLLQGICQRFAKLHPGKKWLYMTAEQFTNEFLEAIKAHKTDAFRRRIRSADLLVIDDVHFLGNKKATQEEFLHTFNQIDGSGKQVVLASDCAPKQIHALSEQLSSRFVSGMVLRVDAPDLPTRLEILRRRVMKNGWQVSDAVLMHLAQSASSSVRELEGLLLQVMAGIRLINTGHEAEASTILTSIKDRTAMRGPVPTDRIVTCVAEHFSLSPAVLMGSGREKVVATARAIAMHLARQHTGMSYPEIGRAIGGKNHSTVIAACQRVEGLISGGDVLCWNTAEGSRHQAVSDILHDLEAAIRRVR
ncbi:MAG TPA: chromosomal replication initiator protein DnaA [Phycisphaerae bacterium]|nr:chromosomal replication initiator protein DnaA [Phycisphaerae bacterium]